MYYWVYRFAVKSDFELPELREISRAEAGIASTSPVEVVAGPVPEHLPGEIRRAAWFSHSGRNCLFAIPDVGRMLVEDGRRVTIDMMGGALESDMRTYLIGSGLGTIAHQRGLLPLHVSAVLGPHGAIAFTGPSGAGKSTAAATLHEKLGWPIVSDDVAILVAEDDRIWLEGGVRRLRLWSDALDRLAWSDEGLERDTYRTDKFLYKSDHLFAVGAQPLSALYEIHAMPGGGLVKLRKGAEKFEVLINSVYRPFLVRICQARPSLHRTVGLASRRITCWRGPRPDVQTVQDICAEELFVTR